MSNHHDVFLIDLRRLADSPSQPRTEYHGLDELADSIREQGVLQPIICRPITQQPIGANPDEDLEIIAGHRRVRAARMAELDEIPAIIRPMSDLQVLQVQIVENLQREDVSPLDEGRAYAALRDQHSQTPKQIADTLGTSVRHVMARIQLLQLTGRARKALADGLIGSDIALLICAVPSVVHDQALELVTRTLETGERLALPVRAARANLRSAKLLHGIMYAPFDIMLPALIDSAGPCLQCPRLSTCMGDDALEQLGADVCTDRTCYTAKLAAHTQRELGNLADSGWTILDEEPAFGSWKKIEGECIDNIAKAVVLDPALRAHCIAWPEAVTGLHAQGVMSSGYRAMLAAIYPATPTPTPAAAPANEGERGGDDETSIATPKDTSYQEPIALAHEGGRGAQEVLRDLIALHVMRGNGWPPGKSDLVMVCAALAFLSDDEPLAFVGLTGCHDPAAILDELTRWPENRLALTTTALSMYIALDALPQDRSTTLLTQLHTRYLGGDVDKASCATGAETEDQPSLTAGNNQTDDAAASGRPTTAAEAQYEAGQLTTPATIQRPTRKQPSARYQCPTTGQTWTGRGLKPRWLANALQAGAVLSDFDTHQAAQA